MKPKRFIDPKLHRQRNDTKPSPIRGPWNFTNAKASRLDRNRFGEVPSFEQRAGLLTCPRPYPACTISRRKMCINLGVRNLLNLSTNTNLSVQRLPMQHPGSLHIAKQLSSLLRLCIGIKDQSFLIQFLQ